MNTIFTTMSIISVIDIIVFFLEEFETANCFSKNIIANYKCLDSNSVYRGFINGFLGH